MQIKENICCSAFLPSAICIFLHFCQLQMGNEWRTEKVTGVQSFQILSGFSKILKKKKIKFEEFGCCDKAKSSVILACCNAVMGLQADCCSKASTLVPIHQSDLHKVLVKFGMLVKLGCKCTFYIFLGSAHTYFQSSLGFSSVSPLIPVHQWNTSVLLILVILNAQNLAVELGVCKYFSSGWWMGIVRPKRCEPQCSVPVLSLLSSNSLTHSPLMH